MSDVRARIGFTSIAYVTEVFPQVFYQIAPQGVILSMLTVEQRASTPEEMKRVHTETLSHVRSFARAGCDVVFLGGAPTNLAHGPAYLENLLEDLRQELGVPVSSGATAHNNAMLAVGANKVGVVHPFSSKTKGRHDQQLTAVGLTPAGCIGADAILEDYHLIPKGRAYALGVELKRQSPELDTIYFACPHWHVVDAIEPLERELEVSVIASIQATVWEGMRLAGLADRIEGMGRLLREH
jgi:maleate isomerase